MHALVSQFSCSLGTKQPFPLAVPATFNASKHKRESCYLSKVIAQDQLLFANLDWSIPAPTLISSPLEHYLNILANSCHTGAIEDLHVHLISPLILAAMTATTKEDNSTWWQAMNGPYAKEFWMVAVIKIETLKCIKAWTVVSCTEDLTYVLPSTWTFKIKRYPDGTVKKFKG